MAVCKGNPPVLRGLGCRIYAAVFSLWTGVIPPLPMLRRLVIVGPQPLSGNLLDLLSAFEIVQVQPFVPDLAI